MTPDPRKVFVIHGRNVRAAVEMKTFLRALDFVPIIFNDLRAEMGGTPTIAEIVTRGMDDAKGVVALFTADEYALLRKELYSSDDGKEDQERWQARPNVIFEAGMAFGRARDRVVLAVLGDVRLFTDVAGIHLLRVSNDISARSTLRLTLAKITGHALSPSSEWHSAGDFENCTYGTDERLNPVGYSLRGRDVLPRMATWHPAMKARDILIIGLNLNLVLRQSPFFEAKLREGAHIRLLIVNPKNRALIDVASEGVVERTHAKGDYETSRATILSLRRALPDDEKSRLNVKTVDYVPTLSGQVLDGADNMSGTVLVELTPNRMEVAKRPHFILYANNLSHAPWYEHFVRNFEDMYTDATSLPWDE